MIVRYCSTFEYLYLLPSEKNVDQSQLHLFSFARKQIFDMVQMLPLAALCSSLVGLGSAAALGSAEEYADGSVHARIMGMKMVRQCTLYSSTTNMN